MAWPMGIPQLVPILFCDNQSIIAQAKNPMYHVKTMQIVVQYHFIEECIVGFIRPEKVTYQENGTNPLTKDVPFIKEGLVVCCVSLEKVVSRENGTNALTKPLSLMCWSIIIT